MWSAPASLELLFCHIVCVHCFILTLLLINVVKCNTKQQYQRCINQKQNPYERKQTHVNCVKKKVGLFLLFFKLLFNQYIYYS